MELPKVYANKIDKNFDNNNDYFRSRDDEKVDFAQLRSLFDRNGFGDRIFVEIKTNSGWSLEKLVLLKNNCFININNKKIYFDDILDYKIKK